MPKLSIDRLEEVKEWNIPLRYLLLFAKEFFSKGGCHCEKRRNETTNLGGPYIFFGYD